MLAFFSRGILSVCVCSQRLRCVNAIITQTADCSFMAHCWPQPRLCCVFFTLICCHRAVEHEKCFTVASRVLPSVCIQLSWVQSIIVSEVCHKNKYNKKSWRQSHSQMDDRCIVFHCNYHKLLKSFYDI